MYEKMEKIYSKVFVWDGSHMRQALFMERDGKTEYYFPPTPEGCDAARGFATQLECQGHIVEVDSYDPFVATVIDKGLKPKKPSALTRLWRYITKGEREVVLPR